MSIISASNNFNNIKNLVQKYKSWFDDSDKITEEAINHDTHVEYIIKNKNESYYMKQICYANINYLHRVDGPAIIIEISKFLDLDNNTTGKIFKDWFVNNNLFPDWVPKIENNLVYGNCNKKIIFDVITKFDREYGVFLNKTYSSMNENKNNLKKDFQQLLLSMVQFYKETTLTQISNEIMNQMGILLPEEMNKIQNVIEENTYELIINNNILYDKERDKISIT